ncbi:hypothetical protein [Rhodococcoides yunnanense]|uniref:hypothetical protein n=1 Tax=Rhodococcoides yunnanense TaxID=278209 RepID=UPI000933CC21|nr:hypothetical protein [Rhodococcus yunnanensis]
MTRRAGPAIVLTATSALCLACGANTPVESTADATAPLSTVTAPDPLLGAPITDSAVLHSAMISLEQLPDGYAVIPDPVRDLGLDPAPDYDNQDRSGTDPQRCADVAAPIAQQSAGAVASADVRYSGPDFSSIDEDAASYTGRGASDAFAAVQATFAACGTYSGTDADGVAVDYTLESNNPAGTVGDASTSVRLRIESGGFTLVSDVVVAVVDSTVVQVVATDQDGVDEDTLTALANTAVGNIRGANKGT